MLILKAPHVTNKTIASTLFNSSLSKHPLLLHTRAIIVSTFSATSLNFYIIHWLTQYYTQVTFSSMWRDVSSNILVANIAVSAFVLFYYIFMGTIRVCLLSHYYFFPSRVFHQLTHFFSREFEWQQLSSNLRTLLSILANLNNAVVLMPPFCPLYSQNPIPFTKGIVPSAPIKSGVTVTLMFHSMYFSCKV